MEESNIVSIGGQPIKEKDIHGETVEEVLERLKEMLPDAKNVFIVASNDDDTGDIYTFSNFKNVQEVYWYLSIIMHETLAQ